MSTKPIKEKRRGTTYYRVRIRRSGKGLSVDKLFLKRSEAVAFIRKVEGDQTPVQVNAKGMTLNALVRWCAKNPTKVGKSKYQSYSETTLKNSFSRWKKICEYNGFGYVLLSNLTYESVNTLFDQMQEQYGWGSQTRYRNESVLSGLFNIAVRNNLIDRNIMRDARNRFKEPKRRNRLVTEDEFKRLSEACDDLDMDRLKAWLHVIWETGARRGELLKLTWDCVELIPHEILGAELIFRADTTKNQQEKRLFITKPTLALLEDAKIDDRYCFHEGTLYKDFDEVRHHAGLAHPDPIYGETITFHHLRHALATRLAQSGATLDELMTVGGWKTTSQAERYLHLVNERAKTALLRLHQ